MIKGQSGAAALEIASHVNGKSHIDLCPRLDKDFERKQLLAFRFLFDGVTR